jgi:hypothetical protein
VPLPNAANAVAELTRAIGLGARGIMVPANVEGTNIGELPLDPLWAKAEESGYPVIVHPVLTGPAPRAAKFGLTQSTQYTFDTTLGAGSLLSSPVSAFKFAPNVRIRRNSLLISLLAGNSGVETGSTRTASATTQFPESLITETLREKPALARPIRRLICAMRSLAVGI